MKFNIILMTLLITLSFVACGGGGGSATEESLSPEAKKSTLKQTEQNISFTKYDDGYYKIGQEREYLRENDVVKDLVTGLEWQDSNETGDDEIVFDWAEAQTYCKALELNGKMDWRLPTIYELKTLVVYNKQYPAMSQALQNIIGDFEDGFHDFYWSSTLDASDSTFAWTVGSFWGDDRFYSIFNWAKTRCVRGEKKETFVYKRDEVSGVVEDLVTNLVWQDAYPDMNGTVKKASYTQALAYCEDLVLATKDDWRLPNIKELYSLIDKKRDYPSLDPSFKKVVASDYWSSTADVDYHENLWTVNFAFGDDGTWFGREKEDVFVRCVRGGR